MFPYERPGLVDCSVDISHGQPVAWLYRLRIRERMQCRENVGALHQPPARHGWKCRERVEGLPANVIRNRTHGVRRSYPSVTSSLNPPTSGSGRLSRRQQSPREPFEHRGGSKAVAARNVLVVESDHDAAPVDRTVTTRIGGGPPLLSSDTIGHGCLDEGRDDRARVARTTDARLNRSCRRGDRFPPRTTS